MVWYNGSTGSSVLNTGTTFQTPVLFSPDTFYVEADVNQPSQYAGPADNTIGGGSTFTNNNYHNLYFDCYSTAKLVSVKVYAQGAGNRTITLIQSGNTLQSLTVNIPTGTSRVTLNFDLPVGNNFELGIQGNVDLYRNNSGAVFPYTLGGLVSITGTNAGDPDYYYFFYDWELQEPPCKSLRTMVPVSLNPAPVAAFNSQIVSTYVIDFTDASTGAAH